MKNKINGKVLIAALIIAGVLLCASIVFILERRPTAPVPEENPAPIVMTVLAAPTSTPYALPPTSTPILPPEKLTPSAVPGQVAIGVYVQPATGGDGLRIHTAPSLEASLAFPSPAFDSEVFLVTKGPERADGYTWWYLTAPYDASRAGWAVQDYLIVIPSP
jgi:hypothetical protein